MHWELKKRIKKSRIKKEKKKSFSSPNLVRMVFPRWLTLGTRLPVLNQRTVSGDSKKCGNTFTNTGDKIQEIS